MPTARVAGAGVAGATVALKLARAGWQVHVYDAGGERCATQAGGMLAPLAELDHGEVEITAAGLDAPERWSELLPNSPHQRGGGSLLVALRPELPLLRDLHQRIVRAGASARCVLLDRATLRELEPALSDRFGSGLHLPGEGTLDPIPTLHALHAAIAAAGGQIHSQRVTEVAAGRLRLAGEASWQQADLLVDARGLGARPDLPLRGVRGEFVEVLCPGVTLGRAVRLLHPRHPLYVVPRGGARYYIGATSIESEDPSPPTVQSLLELLSALHALSPSFADATIIRHGVGRRPALAHNLPCVAHEPGLIRINGLFRHGWLLGPILADAATALATGGAPPAASTPFLQPIS